MKGPPLPKDPTGHTCSNCGDAVACVQPVRRLAYSVRGAAEWLSVGETFMRELVTTKKVRSFKEGSKVLVPHVALEEYIARRLSEPSESGIGTRLLLCHVCLLGRAALFRSGLGAVRLFLIVV